MTLSETGLELCLLVVRTYILGHLLGQPLIRSRMEITVLHMGWRKSPMVHEVRTSQCGKETPEVALMKNYFLLR
jgi:hypothetical protein